MSTRTTSTPMSVDAAIRERRSVRGFLAREVPDATLHEIFELAQRAPSNCNVQPWVPHVVSGEALQRLRDELVQAGRDRVPPKPDWPADGRYPGVYRARQVDAAAKLYGAMGVERSDLVGRHAAYVRNLDTPWGKVVFNCRGKIVRLERHDHRVGVAIRFLDKEPRRSVPARKKRRVVRK